MLVGVHRAISPRSCLSRFAAWLAHNLTIKAMNFSPYSTACITYCMLISVVEQVRTACFITTTLSPYFTKSRDPTAVGAVCRPCTRSKLIISITNGTSVFLNYLARSRRIPVRRQTSKRTKTLHLITRQAGNTINYSASQLGAGSRSLLLTTR
jgi:hypothetical protein